MVFICSLFFLLIPLYTIHLACNAIDPISHLESNGKWMKLIFLLVIHFIHLWSIPVFFFFFFRNHERREKDKFDCLLWAKNSWMLNVKWNKLQRWCSMSKNFFSTTDKNERKTILFIAVSFPSHCNGRTNGNRMFFKHQIKIISWKYW